MKPNSAKCIPKNQIAAILSATCLGIAGGLALVWRWNGSGSISLGALVCSILGGILGAVGAGFENKLRLWPSVVGLGLLAIAAPLLFYWIPVSRQIFRELLPGILAGLWAGVAMNVYHIVKECLAGRAIGTE